MGVGRVPGGWPGRGRGLAGSARAQFSRLIGFFPPPNSKPRRDALFRFVDDPMVPIDNSPTEREFQNVAKLRLNMLFAGSTEGAHRACVLLGIVATCRAQGVPAQA